MPSLIISWKYIAPAATKVLPFTVNYALIIVIKLNVKNLPSSSNTPFLMTRKIHKLQS